MDKFPLLKQIEYLRLLIAKEEEKYENAVKNNVAFSTLNNIQADIKLLKEYLQVLLEEEDSGEPSIPNNI